MLFVVEHFESKLRNNSEIVIEDVSLKNFSILLVLFIAGTSHVPNNVKELDEQLDCRMEFFVMNWIIL